MKTINDFKKGQKVQIQDEDTLEFIDGKVLRVVNRESERPHVYIQWDDLVDPVKHFSDEFQLILKA